MDAFGSSKKSRRRQLEAARQRKLDGLPGAVAVAEPGPVPVAEPEAVGDADTAVGDPPRPSTSATERKFWLMSVGAVSDSDSDSDEGRAGGAVATVIARSEMLSALVKGLLCLHCGVASLAIRTIDCKLGLVSPGDVLHLVRGGAELDAVVRPARRSRDRQAATQRDSSSCRCDDGHGCGALWRHEVVPLPRHAARPPQDVREACAGRE